VVEEAGLNAWSGERVDRDTARREINAYQILATDNRSQYLQLYSATRYRYKSGRRVGAANG
jgi:hypothetical protein